MKKLIIVLGVLLLGLVIAYVVCYKTGHCYCDRIPIDVTAVIRLDVRQLEHHVLMDVITHPLLWVNKSNESTPPNISDGASRNMTIYDTCDVNILEAPHIQKFISDIVQWPKDLILFSLDDQYTKWYSDAVKVDTALMKTYLSDHSWKKREINGYQLYYIDRLAIQLDGENARIIFNPKGVNHNETYYKPATKFLGAGHPIFDRISSTHQDIYYTDVTGQQLNLSFSIAAVKLNGHYKLPWLTGCQATLRPDRLGQFSACINKDVLIDYPDTKKLLNRHINIDTLSAHWDGRIDLDLISFTSSVDTIRTYEYDDDFNKKEISSLKTVINPNYKLSIGLHKNILPHLIANRSVQIIGGDTLFTAMPLVKTYLRTSADGLVLYTKDADDINLSGNSTLNIAFNFNEFNKDAHATPYALNDRWSMLKSFNGHINANHEIEAQLFLSSEHNALTSLLGINN